MVKCCFMLSLSFICTLSFIKFQILSIKLLFLHFKTQHSFLAGCIPKLWWKISVHCSFPENSRRMWANATGAMKQLYLLLVSLTFSIIIHHVRHDNVTRVWYVFLIFDIWEVRFFCIAHWFDSRHNLMALEQVSPPPPFFLGRRTFWCMMTRISLLYAWSHNKFVLCL